MQHLQNLACRVSWGDPQAAAELRRELAGPLRPIVRNTLRTRRTRSQLHRFILKEAERMSTRAGEEFARGDEVVGQVIGRVCDHVIDNLWSSHQPVRTLQALLCN